MSYGLEVYGPDGTTKVIGPNFRVSNIALFVDFSIPGNSTITYSCDSASDPSTIMIVIDIDNNRNQNVYTTTSGNNIILHNINSYSRSGTLMAIRVK